MNKLAINLYKNKYFIISVFYIYVLCIYPLIFKIYENNRGISAINRFALFLFIALLFISFASRALSFKKNIIDILNIILILYMTISLLIFTMLSNMLLGDMLREILYSIIPIFFYFFAKTFREKEINLFFSIFFYSTIFVIAVGILNLLGVPLPKEILTQNEAVNFASNYGPIILGYASQLLFALVLFNKIEAGKMRYLLLCLFFVISLLTLQRSPYLGIMCALTIYFLYERKRLGFIFVVIALAGLFYAFLNIDTTNTFKQNVGIHIESEIRSFNFDSVAKSRKSQAIIFNKDNIINILFGEGYGKYSPNNTNTICKMPDASYYRIYNELGLVGTSIFFIPFILLFIKALLKKNGFMIYFILFTLIAFFFNRVLWAVPLSFVIYTLIGISENKVFSRKILDRY